ncbi:hypothetical protein P106B_91 [Rhizobium phage vB_RglS_P106B]|uniref:Uncharacterized protein n=1 Tax=Rhizobium phage vB_RglS_P106B TaxID=1458697 RepID=W6E8Q9_9CAUD|nr:hypothetical protein P106B_91 [Rhizobium phage vB_RglS_P106B]AHJ10774.1 hypothetical protein P106B_91 [Rhizobium phage vB_RglS_P106B]
MANEYRNEFLTKAPQAGPFAAKEIVEQFEMLNDEEQNAVEKNLMHLYSRTWPEQYLWEYIEKNGLRVDRD